MSGTVFDSFLLYMEADMKYKCLIFDLDGTLVNSIHALTYCTNLSLEKFGLGPLTEEQMMTIVGDGYKMQMKRSLAACGDTDEAHYEAILPVWRYSENTVTMRCILTMESWSSPRRRKSWV